MSLPQCFWVEQLYLYLPLFTSSDSTTHPPGYYLYVDGSVGQWGDRSVLIGDVIQPSTAGNCLTFWYHMFGNNIGTLRVYMNDRLLFNFIEHELTFT